MINVDRILAFGCSHTFGTGLPDCDSDAKIPSQLAWPAHVSHQLNIPVKNYGIPAASNKEILHTLLDKNISNRDLVLILWTYTDRTAIITKEYVVKFAPWIPAKDSAKYRNSSRAYYRYIYDKNDHINDFFIRTNFAKYYLDQKGIANLHLSVDFHEKYNFYTNFINQINFLPLMYPEYMDEYGPVTECNHGSIESHKNFGNDIAIYIKENHDNLR